MNFTGDLGDQARATMGQHEPLVMFWHRLGPVNAAMLQLLSKVASR